MRKDRLQPTPELPMRFSDVLFPEVLEGYNRVLTPKQQDDYEAELNKIIRMKGIREKGFVPEDFTETVHRHTVAMLLMAKEYSEKYPEVAKYTKPAETQAAILGHDQAERVIGDIPMTNRTPRQERLKRLEHFAGRSSIRAQIVDPPAQEIALYWFDRYERNDERDLPIQMAWFIDRAQGTTRVAEKVFNIRRVDKDTANRMRMHLWETVLKMMVPAFNLTAYLPEESARVQMKQLVNDELKLLERYGPPEVAKAYMQKIA